MKSTIVRSSITAGKRQSEKPPRVSPAQYALASARVLLDVSRCQTRPVMVSVTVSPSELTTSSPEFVPSPDGSLVPSQLSLEPSQQIEPLGQSSLVVQAMPKTADCVSAGNAAYASGAFLSDEPQPVQAAIARTSTQGDEIETSMS